MLSSSERDALGRELVPRFGSRLSQSEADRLVYSRDLWPRTLLAVRDKLPLIAPPDFIVWPENTEEVADLVRIAERRQVPLVPYGGGSGVCGGAMARSGGIIADLKRMDRIVDVSPIDHLARFEAGINGQVLEDSLNQRGFTLGHFPSSIVCSTLGGWLAARSAGQFSSRYGKIEDMVTSIEAVVGGGRIVELPLGRLPTLAPALIGSEGTLGVITKATLKIHPLPEYRVFRGYSLPRIAAGWEAMRRVMQRGLRPTVLRLYDEMDTLLARPTRAGESKDSAHVLPEALSFLGGPLKKELLRVALSRAGVLARFADALLPRVSAGCLLIIGFEGDPTLVDVEAGLCHAEICAAGGEDLGEEPGLKWFTNRHAISFKMSPVFAAGSFVDTMEVATTWDRLGELYRAVRSALSSSALVLAHFSHAYPEGCSIYFTFAAGAEDRARSEVLYDELWRRGLAAAIRAGGTISHHHGIGLSKADFLPRELGGAMAIYQQLKQVLDPAAIFNPGKMGL